jgi:hypothetical protein
MPTRFAATATGRIYRSESQQSTAATTANYLFVNVQSGVIQNDNFEKRNGNPMSKRGGNGEGSIYRMSDGRWRAAVSLADGKRKTFTAHTRGDVQDLLKAALHDQQIGMLVAPHKKTVGQFLSWWLEEVVRTSARPKTMKFYELVTRIHFMPKLGGVPLQRLTEQKVQTFINSCVRPPSERTGRKLSPRTVHHIHRTLTTALNCAVEKKFIARNVALTADLPPVEKRNTNIRFFSVGQAREFLEAAKSDRLFALYATTLSLGLRLGEALGISWPSVALDTGRFEIRQALQRIDKKLYPDGGLQLVEPKGGYFGAHGHVASGSDIGTPPSSSQSGGRTTVGWVEVGQQVESSIHESEGNAARRAQRIAQISEHMRPGRTAKTTPT